MTAAELPGVPAPGFRVTAAELSNSAAYRAMGEATDSVVRAALAARHTLLALGFADSHSLCLQLDDTAKNYTVVREAIRRQAAPPPTQPQFVTDDVADQ